MADSRSAEKEYYEEKKSSIETALADAVCVVISEKDSDPISRIADLLQHQRTNPPATAKNHQWAVDQALKGYEKSIKGLSKAEIEQAQSWNARQWLDSLELSAIILQPLLKPLQEKERSPGAELPFMHAIGQLKDWTDLFGIMTSHDAFATIAKVMWTSAKTLWEASVAETLPAATQGISKFTDDQMSLGEASMFFKGLDDFIGPPNPNVREAMTHEHTTHKDSTVEFVAHNYETKTTSRHEWFFVVEPKEGLNKVCPSEWPKEQKPPASRADKPDGLPNTGKTKHTRPPGPREPTELTVFEANLNIKNGLLRDLGESPVTWDEFIGARLYTGPMFQKYNGVLRCIGKLRVDQPGQVITESEIEKELRDGEFGKSVKTMGNVYTTTLHVINSACIKLGKLTSAAKVYRGISGCSLPDAMNFANKYKVRGGVEFGFMSATLERRVAMSYASAKPESPALLFEMKMGMIDRGADLSWLSQYPHEREILFAPLSALEVLTQHVEGQACVVEIRLSVNLQALTIEQVISKMQRSHLQLVDLLQDNMRFAGVPPRVLGPLQQLRLKALHQEPSDFNAAEYYRKATNNALNGQESIFKMITADAIWTADDAAQDGAVSAVLDDRAAKMRRTAMLCARVGEHDKAADLLIMWTRVVKNVAATDREAWDAIAHSLIADDGLPAPWPGTLVALVQRGNNTEDGAGFIEKVKELVQEAQAKRPPVFQIGSEVLALLQEEQIWEHARVRMVRDESTSKIEVFDKKKDKKELHKGYDVVSWKERPAIEEHVLAPSVGGPAALLRHAAEKGEVELVGALLEADVSIYESDALANTALILAAKAGHADVCRKLKDAGASEHVRNMSRENAYDLANHQKRTNVLRVFSPYSSDSDVGKQMSKFETARTGKTLTRPCELENGVTMLMLACRDGDLEAVKELLEAKADVLAQTDTGCTALMMAAEEGGKLHVDVVKMLLDGADGKESIEYQMKSGKKTAVMLAATNGHMRVVKLLTKAGADIHVRNQKLKDGKEDDGRTVLHSTCMHGHKDVAEFLLKNKADMNAVNANQETPLMLAARFGHLEVVELLLSQGCNFAKETDESSWSSIHRACGAGHVDVAELLLKTHSLFVNHTDEKGLTPLMAAVGANFSEAAVILMDKEADVRKVDKEGKSAVYIAAQAGQEKSLRVLLTRKDIDVNQANNNKETPLMAACKNGHESTARLLLNAKARFEEEKDHDSLPSNPLMIAAKAGHEPIVRMLLNNGAKKRKEEAAKAAEEALAEEAGGDARADPTTTVERPTAAEQSSPSRQAQREGSICGWEGRLGRFKKIIELLRREEEVEGEAHASVDYYAPASLASAAASGAKTNRVAINSEFDGALSSLTSFKPLHKGQIAPPRPSEEELHVSSTGSGGLRLINGIVVQRGPWNSIWIRAGCVDKVPWSALSDTLKACAKRAIERQRQAVDRGAEPSTIWLGITETTLQCVDFVWLTQAGFAFHHYRKSGHIQLVDEAAAAQHASADSSLEPAEFIYYWRPSSEPKLASVVPSCAMAAEGAAGILLSPDGARVLLVRARGCWSTTGSDVAPSETTLQALQREAKEEMGVDIDFGHPPVYVGGHQQGASRDNLISDNLSAFVVRLKDAELNLDSHEVLQTAWFDWRVLVQQWRASGSVGQPSAGHVELDVAKVATGGAAPCKHSVGVDVLTWLDSYEKNHGIPCKVAHEGGGRMLRIGA